MIRAAIVSEGTNSPLILIKEGWNVNNKVYSASAGRKCVSLPSEALETIISSAKMVSLLKPKNFASDVLRM